MTALITLVLVGIAYISAKATKRVEMRFITSRLSDEASEISHDEFGCSDGNVVTTTVTLDFKKIPVDSTLVKSLKIKNGTRKSEKKIIWVAWTLNFSSTEEKGTFNGYRNVDFSQNEELYEVHRDPTTNPLDAVFHFNKYSWTCDPGGSDVFQVRYNPTMVNERCLDYFTIVNRGLTILRITAKGTSVGPKVSIANDEILMISSLHESVRNRVKLVNESNVEAIFVFDVDVVQNSFKPCPTEGSIGPNSHVYIVITFEPKYQGYHVSLLPCLIQHQAPILIRLYGYCGKQRKERKISIVPTLIYPTLDKNTFKVYMLDCNHIRKIKAASPCQRDPISLSSSYIDFGRYDLNIAAGMNRPSRTTCFTNHAFSDMLLKWHNDVDGTFSLSPNAARVKAGETCLIEVHFHPREENIFYEREFQAIVFYLEDDTCLPIFDVSMIASLRLIGHTFPADASTWIPQYDVPRNVIMPPCLPSGSVYTTFLIKKSGHLPIMYRFVPPGETSFTVKPMQGVIQKNNHTNDRDRNSLLTKKIYNLRSVDVYYASDVTNQNFNAFANARSSSLSPPKDQIETPFKKGSYQVIVVEMSPKNNECLHYERWAIRFNGNPNYEVFVDFRGYADEPRLNFDQILVQYPSTHPNCERVKPVLMMNPTRHHINYRFVDIPAELRVDTVEGKIYSNEILTHNWTFCSPEEGHYELAITCCYSACTQSENQNGETITYVELPVVATCERGYLLAKPSELVFEKLPYDEARTISFELTNSSTVEVPYLLTVQPGSWSSDAPRPEQRVQLQPILANLLPGDEKTVVVSLEPGEPGYHEFSIGYCVRKDFQIDPTIPTKETTEICRLKYFCELPVIKIEDLMHYRIGNKIGKYVLWRLLNISRFYTLRETRPPAKLFVKYTFFNVAPVAAILYENYNTFFIILQRVLNKRCQKKSYSFFHTPKINCRS